MSQIFDAKMADFVIMSQMFDDDNNSSRLSYTCEMLVQTDSEEEMFPDHIFIHVPGEFMSTPKSTPRSKPHK